MITTNDGDASPAVRAGRMFREQFANDPGVIAAMARVRARFPDDAKRLQRAGSAVRHKPIVETRDGQEWPLRFTEHTAEGVWQWTGRPLDAFAEMRATEFFMWGWTNPNDLWVMVLAAVEPELDARRTGRITFLTLQRFDRGEPQVLVDLIFAVRQAVAETYPDSVLGRELVWR